MKKIDKIRKAMPCLAIEKDVTCQPTATLPKQYEAISEEELQLNCISLTESKRLMLERIHRDFHTC
ncbi:MAG: hypothetical protein LBM06_02065 [Prevotellaceae bacterium]|nr:hypothetical protein [Prevotellaceae bacterium]